ncbi:MAG: 30S ribosomal protein S10 [Mycoplasmataceae bacterium]|jgi:small subunit ribosomal protein S10|nr:30S ribosomal protein S10 [Mycoplasmataceae bacterium]
MANNVYKIKLLSYDVAVLENTVRKVLEVATQINAKVDGPIPLPTKREVFSILRDPFVHKNTMEQFERRTHKRLIILSGSSEILNELKKISVPSSVEVVIK